MAGKKLYVTISNKRGKSKEDAMNEVLEHLKELDFIDYADARYLGLFELEVKKRNFEIERVYDEIPIEKLL